MQGFNMLNPCNVFTDKTKINLYNVMVIVLSIRMQPAKNHTGEEGEDCGSKTSDTQYVGDISPRSAYDTHM